MADNKKTRGNQTSQGQQREDRSIGNKQGTTQTGSQNNGGRNRTADEDLNASGSRSSSNRDNKNRSTR